MRIFYIVIFLAIGLPAILTVFLGAAAFAWSAFFALLEDLFGVDVFGRKGGKQ